MWKLCLVCVYCLISLRSFVLLQLRIFCYTLKSPSSFHLQLEVDLVLLFISVGDIHHPSIHLARLNSHPPPGYLAPKMSTIVTSPHPDLDIPECTLPELLLGLGSGAQKLSAGADVSAPIFYPAPNAPRLLAKRGAPAGGDAEHGKEADDAKRNSIFNLDNLKNTLADAVGLNGKAEEKPKVPLDFDSTGPIGLVQIRSIAERVAVSLLSAFPGWKKGDVVAFYSANQHDYCAAVMGVQMAGGIAALCNPSYKPWELATQLRKIKPSLILATTETFEAAEQASHMATGKASDEEVEKLAPLVKTPALMTFDETHSASWEKELLTPPQDAWARKEELLASVKVDPKKDAAVYCFR